MAPKTEKGRAVLAIVTPLAVAAGIVVVALPWSWGRATTRGGTDSAERPSRLWLVACAVLGWFAVRFIQRATFALRAYQRGCLPAAVYPHRDVLLGLDAFVPALRAIKANTFFELTRHRFASVGNTFWTNNLGQWVLMTIEPENIKALCMQPSGHRIPSLGRFWQAKTSVRPRLAPDPFNLFQSGND